jgi:hypothetical protein
MSVKSVKNAEKVSGKNKIVEIYLVVYSLNEKCRQR